MAKLMLTYDNRNSFDTNGDKLVRRGIQMKVIPYEKKYKKDVERICIDTGSPDNQVNPEHRKFTVWMYCDPYLENGTAFLLLDDEEKVQGYILCAEDILAFERKFEPYKEKIVSECPHFKNRLDFSLYEKYGEDYPAHLHIDIEENCTGKGSGTQLMHALIKHLQEKKVKGLMVIVDLNNKRAYSFYQKMGFQILEKLQGGAVMGMKL